jgi:hypothetical protein
MEFLLQNFEQFPPYSPLFKGIDCFNPMTFGTWKMTIVVQGLQSGATAMISG